MLVLYNHPKFSFSQPEPEEGRGRRPVLGLPPCAAEFFGRRRPRRAGGGEAVGGGAGGSGGERARRRRLSADARRALEDLIFDLMDDASNDPRRGSAAEEAEEWLRDHFDSLTLEDIQKKERHLRSL